MGLTMEIASKKTMKVVLHRPSAPNPLAMKGQHKNVGGDIKHRVRVAAEGNAGTCDGTPGGNPGVEKEFGAGYRNNEGRSRHTHSTCSADVQGNLRHEKWQTGKTSQQNH